jgi:hypothetical protein
MILLNTLAWHFSQKNCFNRVIHEFSRLGGESGQFRHNRASNPELGMKILQSKITGTQTSFPKSLIPAFLFPERRHCSYLYNYYNYSSTICIKCISCLDLVKFHYFANSTERGWDRRWKQAQRQGEELVTLLVTLISKGWFNNEADPRVMGRVVWPVDFRVKTCVAWIEGCQYPKYLGPWRGPFYIIMFDP